ncbi:MAG TPA: GH1 family beta-glucosidase [Baekduia sp.]|uniref:GH1 family beta-glucosidase n=1 Tax=Baekduia sp. TaxID=2600305 RepID=UPI002D79706F|nr:GH1 family beta-glucosidase [Baekduia sp.]HET6510345.1 GH1 family beta-glucosidase [Baekduia sp.]
MTAVDARAGTTAEAGAEPFAPPPGFRFGVATAAYQIEGSTLADGRGESIWDRFAHTPGKVADGDTGDVACDHYRRWRSDVELMDSLHVESYRFSIAWPRIQPTGVGTVNRRGLDFYKRLAESLRERGIEPVATLYHWDLPQALQNGGGWDRRDTVERFAEYARVVGDELGDVVASWITQNEPWCTAFLGNAIGRKAPGLTDWATALRVSHHLLLSHGRATEALRSVLPGGGEVGIALNLFPVLPAVDDEAHREAARVRDGYVNRWFLDPVFKGAYPEDMVERYEREVGPLNAVRDGDLEAIAAPCDFFGVNYYNPMRVEPSPDGPLHVRDAESVGPVTGMGWEIDPDGLKQILARVREEYTSLPIMITENGSAFEDAEPADGVVEDPQRRAYLAGHLAAIGEALADGADVTRYFVWSLLDNFEWEDGYAQRFGIVHVDFETQARTPKASALFYKDYIDRARKGS